MITLEILSNIYRETPKERLRPFVEPINMVLEKYEISTLPRCRMFLAQIGHESGQLKWLEELASGKAYEGRLDLGNTQIGDGVKYKGRGVIQITGRHNYEQCALDLGLPLVEKPELLKQLPHCVLAAGWFWKKNKLNSYCDSGDFIALTKKINGGLNGIEDRTLLLKRAIEAIPG